MIVAGERQHAAMPRRTGRIGMLQRVDRTVHAGSLAVPDPEHAIDLGARKHPDLLAAPHCGCREVFIQPRDEGDVLRLQKRLGAPQRVVVHAERRAAIAGNETGGVEILQTIAFALQHRQPYQRLDSGKIDSLGLEPVFVVQPDLHQRHHLAPLDRFGGAWKVWQWSCCSLFASIRRVLAGRRPQAGRSNRPVKTMRRQCQYPQACG